MADPAPESAEGAVGQLERCIRDLSALSALPTLCVGRSPADALEIVMDALPTVLGCELVWLTLPGALAIERARLRGHELIDDSFAQLKTSLGQLADPSRPVALADGTQLWCRQVDLPIGKANGRLVVGDGNPLDADTDRVLIRSAANLVGAALEAANVLDAAQRKDEFLAMLGHELRNPLAPIMTAVELLARHPAAAREQKVIERQARHLARLVDDLLDISRVTSGHIELKSEPVSLGTVLERAVELASPLIMRHRHSLRIGSVEGVTVRGDLVRLAQVFGNLLTNAAEVTAPEGRIEVTVQKLPERVRVTVRDNGRGIASAQLSRIFEPFVQAHGAHDAARGGLGLGLAIVKSLVERHGGSISVDSKGDGQGASFAVELTTVAEAPTTVSQPAPRAQTERSGLRVLIVDDNVDIAQLLSEALELEGYRTTTAHDALTALDAWRSFHPQAGILDLGLPQLDGYELARKLRAEHGTAPVLIAATGYGQPEDRLRSADAGFDVHLTKPVSLNDLVRVLDRRLAVSLDKDERRARD